MELFEDPGDEIWSPVGDKVLAGEDVPDKEMKLNKTRSEQMRRN